MNFDKLHRGVQELLLSGVQISSWGFRNLIGQDKEWTPTKLHREVSSGANVNPLDDVILVDCSASAVTMVLETAVGCSGRQHTFKKIDSSANAMIVDGNGSETIDGTADLRYTVQHVAFTVKSDGVNWRTVAAAHSHAFQSGSYTPTPTNTTNVAASSAGEAHYMRVGNIVSVAGRLDIDPTSADASITLLLSLPIASAFAAVRDLAGVSNPLSTDANGRPLVTSANVANATAQIVGVPNHADSRAYSYVYAYKVT